MPSKCCVVGCSNRGGRDEGIRFFRFPALRRTTQRIEDITKKRRIAWLATIRRTDLKIESLKYTRICSEHFISGCPAEVNDMSNPDWIPNRNMGHDLQMTTKRKPISKKSSPCNFSIIESQQEIKDDRTEYFRETEKLKLELIEKDKIIKQFEIEKQQIEKHQEEIIIDYENKLKEKEAVLQKAIQQIQNKEISFEALENDDKKVKYFTGLPNFEVLNQLFNIVKDGITTCSSKHIKNFEAFLLTLIKLRLDLPFTYLAYKYGVSNSMVSRIFQANIMALHANIKEFVTWPDKNALALSIPPYFKSTLGCKFTAMIHCFEMFVETAGALPRSGILPSSKHHSTMKYLLATSPGGAIIFVSKGYSGKCSDNTIVETSGFLDNTEAGDIILSVHGMLANVVIVNKGQKLLVHQVVNGDDEIKVDHITRNKNLASIKWRVDRVIGHLRKTYKILTNRQPVETYKTDNDEIYIDYIVRTCCALVNLSPTVKNTENA